MNAAVDSAAGRIAWGRWLVLSLVVLIIDQLTKFEVTSALVLYQRIPVLPFFDIVRLHNTGAAFSFLADASGWQNTLFMVVAVVVVIGVLWWLAQLPRRGKALLALGLALLIGGAIGNLVDRVLYGHVVDFLLFYYGEWAFPAFNVADSAITCGVGLVLFDGMVLEPRAARQADGSS
jgi:signal peptidase II